MLLMLIEIVLSANNKLLFLFVNYKNNMDAVSIVDYIKQNYPKVMFNPIKFAYTNAVGFIITNGKIVIGFINKNGNLCKLSEPIDLAKVTHEDMAKVLKKIPVVSGFTEGDKKSLMKLFEKSANGVSQEDYVTLKAELTQQLTTTIEAEYNVKFDSQSKQMVMIQKEYEENLDKVKQQYEEKISVLEQNKTKILEEKEEIINKLTNYQNEMKEYIKGKEVKLEELEGIFKQMQTERETLKKQLDDTIQLEELKKKQLEENDQNVEKIKVKEGEIEQLQKNIEELNQKLKEMEDDMSKSRIKTLALEGYRERCQEKIINEREVIVQQIRQYNEKWMEWSKSIKSNFESHKKRLIDDLQTLEKNLKVVLSGKSELTRENKQLRQNIKEIQGELQKTITEQLIKLNEKDEQLKMMQQAGVGFVVDPVNESTEDFQVKIQERDARIEQLQRELEAVKLMIVQNNKTKIDAVIDYDNCYTILQNFFALNNIFYRKQEIMKRLDTIIYNGMGQFTELNEATQNNIKKSYETVKASIEKHIKFLDLERYVKSEEFVYLKSKATRNKVSKSFCDELTAILDYWNENKAEYREQDRQLTNIYEDLSGAVRVYIRIKPLIGVEQKSKTVSLQTIDTKKQKSIIIDCTAVKNIKNNVKRTFGEFYGVFEESFSNLDVYTGIENSKAVDNSLKVDVDNIIESSETVSPGLYNAFKQVEDGYSIVVFGYGLSGSGKSFTLLGAKGIPGLIHYGLANLQGVSKIKLKYLFEQYYSAVDVNFGTIRGKIHNLVREVPQLNDSNLSKNENAEFAKGVPSSLNLENLSVEDLYALTDVIEQYRIQQKRIKQTPNNPVSSRSHLYFVFEVTFDTGKTGYVTIVDTAGRESPIDIYNTFIETGKTQLASIMSPAGGEPLIEKTKREGLEPTYTPRHIFEVLKEGFYINESINHLVYFFNKKNYKTMKTPPQASDPSKYSKDKFYISPISESQSINNAKNCLTIPIMKFLDTLSNKNKSSQDYKPTKFIMMCMVRQEERYCDQIFETLEFAQNVKSS